LSGGNPIKIAVCFAAGEGNAADVVERMAAAQEMGDLHRHRLFELGTGAAAVVTSKTARGSVALQRAGSTGNLLIITGVPIVISGDLDKKLASLVEGGYEGAGRELADLEGAYAALFWDERARKLVIVTDILGMQPVYILRRPGLLLLASDMRGLTAGGGVGAEIDPLGWAAFFQTGTTFGNDTSIRGIKRLDPAGVFVYAPASDHMEHGTYWRWPQPQPKMRLEDVDTDYLAGLLEREMNAYLVHRGPCAVMLSGGFDSRLLLAMLRKMGQRPRAVVLTHEDECFGVDGLYASRVARCLRVPWERRGMDADFFSSRPYLDYLKMNEVATPSLYLFIAQLAGHLRPEMGSIWEGAFIGAFLGHFLWRGETISDYMTSEMGYPTDWAPVRKVFAPQLAEAMIESFRERLDAEKDGLGDDGFGALQFMIRHRTRNRFAPNPLKVFGNVVPAFTPGMSRAFVDFAAALPFDVRVGCGLYLKLYRERFPELARIPFCSGGHLVAPPKFALLHVLTAAANKVCENARIAGVLRKLCRRRFFRPSRLLAPVIARVQADHPDLNGAGVRDIRLAVEKDPTRQPHEARLLFYWQLWRWIMEGEMDAVRDDILGEALGGNEVL